MRGNCVNRRQNSLRNISAETGDVQAGRAPLFTALAAALVACVLAGGCGAPSGRAPGPVLEAARAQNVGGTRALAAGNATAALALYQASLAGAESVEDFDLAGANLLNIALAHAQLGQWSEAHVAADKVIAAPQHYGQASAARAAARKALIHLDEGNAQAALRWADNADGACGAPCPFAATLENLRAHLALEQAQNEPAIRHASRAAELAATPDLESERATAWRLLGRAYSRAGRTAEAARLLASALELDRGLGLAAPIALDLLYAGDNEANRGEPARAREFYARAASVYAAAGNPQSAESARSRLDALGK
jgi:tetratricopeptide (TPR) repeat protein